MKRLLLACALLLPGCELALSADAFPRPEPPPPVVEEPPDASAPECTCKDIPCGLPDNCGKACLAGSGCIPARYSVRRVALTPGAEVVSAATGASRVQAVRVGVDVGEAQSSNYQLRRVIVAP